MVSAQRARACHLRETEADEREGCLTYRVPQSSCVKPLQELILDSLTVIPRLAIGTY